MSLDCLGKGAEVPLEREFIVKGKKFKVLVLQDGRVVIDGVPVKKGQQVEVTVKVMERPRPTMPLRGLPVRFIDPFLPAVDESEWDAEK